MNAPALSFDSDVLDYEALFSDYRAGLVDRLRGFGAAADCLALWVPDEDPATSLRNLWDAAAAVGQASVAVHIGPETTARLDQDEVLATAARFGVATLTHGRRGWLVEVEQMHAAEHVPSIRPFESRTRFTRSAEPQAAPPKHVGVHPIYVDAIARAAEDPRHEGSLSSAVGLDIVHVESGGVALELAIDPVGIVIRHAAFTGAPTGYRGLMERFCQLLEGMPLLEAVNHGVIRLEFALRDHWSHRPVAGIVTPRAADPCFELPLALIRAALAAFRERTGYAECSSSFDAGPGPAWRALARDERGAAIRGVVDRLLARRGGAPSDVELVAIEFDVRLVLRVADAIAERPRFVLELERALRDEIDTRLEVYLEEIRDKNKLRRLAVVES